jgi:hypothetical protein|tara:strand:+ start:460 stop:591 length:132 start_codon:yes stop_codon:yes gene_type:complete
MLKFMLEYIKENKGKAIQDIVLLVGISAMAGMLLFIGSLCLTN